MTLKFEFHDSVIKEIEHVGGDLVFHFSKMVILTVTDGFGFEFEKTQMLPGSIVLRKVDTLGAIS